MEIKKITHVDKIQFKRCLDYKGSYKDAIAAVKKMKPALKSGEPMIVSFCENPDDTTYSYFLAIGRNIRVGKRIVSSPVITPFFANVTDDISNIFQEYFDKYIKDVWNIVDLADLQTEDSSAFPSQTLKLATDASGNLIVAVVNNTGDDVDVITNQLTEEGTYEDITINKLGANNQAISYIMQGLYDPSTQGLTYDSEGNAYIGNMGTFVAVTQDIVENIFQLQCWGGI